MHRPQQHPLIQVAMIEKDCLFVNRPGSAKKPHTAVAAAASKCARDAANEWPAVANIYCTSHHDHGHDNQDNPHHNSHRIIAVCITSKQDVRVTWRTRSPARPKLILLAVVDTVVDSQLPCKQQELNESSHANKELQGLFNYLWVY